MGMREKLIDLAHDYFDSVPWYADIADLNPEELTDHLIANGVTIQSWIPVTERLPEPMKWVLCACRANIIDVLRYDHIMDDWDTTMPNRCMMKGFVTHWMPLPEPPSGERRTDETL